MVNDLRSLYSELVDVELLLGDGCLLDKMGVVCVHGICAMWMDLTCDPKT